MSRPWETDEERDELALAYIRTTGRDDIEEIIDILGLNGRPINVRYDKLGISRGADKRRRD